MRTKFIGLCLALSLSCPGQNAGEIFKPASLSPNFFDANLDGWVTRSGDHFELNESLESEASFFPIYGLGEPSYDLYLAGTGCKCYDIVDAQENAPFAWVAFVDFDGIPENGNEFLKLRIRVSRDPGSNNFSVNILFDLDMRMGSSGPHSDPDFRTGNPGFEIEAILQNSGMGKLRIENVNNPAATLIRERDKDLHSQYSYALRKDSECYYQPVFIDILIPLADLHIPADTNIRLAIATTNNGGSALNGNVADIGGINNGVDPDQDVLFETLVNASPPIKLSDLITDNPPSVCRFKGRFTEYPGVELGWITQWECGSATYEIERKLPGAGFENIHTRSVTECMLGQNNYQFTDSLQAGIYGNIYYRLKIINADGSSGYSKVVKVNVPVPKTAQISIFPNPVSDFLTVSLISNVKQQDTRISLIDINGRVLIEEELKEDYRTMDVSHLTAGWYYLRTSSGQEESIVPLFINH